MKGLSRHHSQINLFNKKTYLTSQKVNYSEEEIELKFNCKDLIKPKIDFKNSTKITKNHLKQLDPILKLYSIKTLPNKRKVDIFLDSTDAKKLTKNPNFLKPVILYYKPELTSNLKIKVFHKTEFFKDILIGETEFEFETFDDQPLKPLELILRNDGRYSGKVFVRKQLRSVQDFEYTVTLKLEEKEYKKVGGNLRNYFIRFFRPLDLYGCFDDAEEIPQEAWILSKETGIIGREREIIKFQVPCYDFCAGKSNFWLKAEVYKITEKADKYGNKARKVKLASDGFFMLKDLEDEEGALLSTFNKKADHHLDIKFLPVIETGETTFPSFVKTGLKFSISSLIDFSKPNFKGFDQSFHSQSPTKGLNKYESAIGKIMPIFGNLNNCSRLSVSGFNFESTSVFTGKVYPFKGKFNTTEILEQYRGALEKKVFPEEKLDLKEYLELFLHQVQQGFDSGDVLRYHISLIFTAGEFTEECHNFERKEKILSFVKNNLDDEDIEEDKNSIKNLVKNLSELPVSLFIICLDPSNYDSLMLLSGKKGEIKKLGVKRNFINLIPYDKYDWNLDVLERELLRNLPEQVREFYHENVLNKID